jgi:biotin transport system substrate-specific component
LGGIVVIYAFGIPGIVMKTELTFAKASLAAVVFVPGDVLKCLIAAWIASRIRPRLI